MSRFKLAPRITFTPEGGKYLILDEHTGSKFRVGEMEYQILKQFEETTNPEEVAYRLRALQEINVPQNLLHQFIRDAISLGLLRVESDSFWGRMIAVRASGFRFPIFDPNPGLDFLMKRMNFLFKRQSILAMIAVGIAGSVAAVALMPKLWVFKSATALTQLPPGFLYCIAIVFLLSILHEMAHALAGKLNGFEIKEVGIHLHYFLPAFYCRIFRRQEASRNSQLAVLAAGPLIDLILLSLLLVGWLLLPPGSAEESWAAMMICMLMGKIWLIQLNPLWPYSDGFHIARLWLNKEEARK